MLLKRNVICVGHGFILLMFVHKLTACQHDRYLDIIVNRQTNYTVWLAWQHDLDISSTKDDLCDISHNVSYVTIVFEIHVFDFTANDFSRSFEPYVKSNAEFSRRFRNRLKPKESLSLNDSIELDTRLVSDSDNLNVSIPESPEFPIKRPAPMPASLPEVSAPPDCVKRAKTREEAKQSWLKHTQHFPPPEVKLSAVRQSKLKCWTVLANWGLIVKQ